MLGHRFDRVPGTKSCLETIKPWTGVSLGAAHGQTAAWVNRDGPKVAPSILIGLESEEKTNEWEERRKRQVEMNDWFSVQLSINRNS